MCFSKRNYFTQETLSQKAQEIVSLKQAHEIQVKCFSHHNVISLPQKADWICRNAWNTSPAGIHHRTTSSERRRKAHKLAYSGLLSDTTNRDSSCHSWEESAKISSSSGGWHPCSPTYCNQVAWAIRTKTRTCHCIRTRSSKPYTGKRFSQGSSSVWTFSQPFWQELSRDLRKMGH